MKRVLWSVVVLGGFCAIMPATVQAQVARYPAEYGQPSAWVGAPTSPWVTYTPGGWAGYAPSARAGAVYQPTVPQVTYGSPVATVPSTVAWQGYVPSAEYARPVVVTRNRNERNWFGRMPGGAYREFGSGRPVPLAKPWLPGSP